MFKITRVDLYRSAISVVLTALSMKIQVLWDINPFDCLPIDTSQRPRNLECRHAYLIFIVRYFIIIHNSLLARSCVIFKLDGRIITEN